MPYNCKPSKLFSTGIHMDRIKSFTKQIPVRHLLFIMDYCVSKRARIQLEKDDVAPSSASFEELMRNNAVQVLTAGYKGQQNHSDDSMSVFTDLFIQGINGAAFLADYAWINVDELATWLQRKVSDKTQDTQFPQYERLDFGNTGSFVFLNPNDSQKVEGREEKESDEDSHPSTITEKYAE